MKKIRKRNAFYAQSGGVTAVINASACGVIEACRKHKKHIGKLFAGRDGILGALNQELIDTSFETDIAIRNLKYTPGGAFGSCRYKLKNYKDDDSDYKKLLKPLIENRADAVYGSRFLGSGEKRVLFFWHRFGNYLLTLFSNSLTNLNLTDMEVGYKAFKKEVFSDIVLEEKRFGFEPEITAKIAKKKLRIFEVGIKYYGRTYAEGKKINWKDGVSAIYCILKYNLFK